MAENAHLTYKYLTTVSGLMTDGFGKRGEGTDLGDIHEGGFFSTRRRLLSLLGHTRDPYPLVV